MALLDATSMFEKVRAGAVNPQEFAQWLEQQRQAACDDEYQNGYKDGYDQGYETGYDVGSDSGIA